MLAHITLCSIKYIFSIIFPVARGQKRVWEKQQFFCLGWCSRTDAGPSPSLVSARPFWCFHLPTNLFVCEKHTQWSMIKENIDLLSELLLLIQK